MPTTILKFGHLKSYDCTNWSEEAREIHDWYVASLSNPGSDYKLALCDLIDALPDQDQIFLWFDGEYVSKEQAKQYVKEYNHE